MSRLLAFGCQGDDSHCKGRRLERDGCRSVSFRRTRPEMKCQPNTSVKKKLDWLAGGVE